MRFLLDEGMPVQLLSPLRLNTAHEFAHVDELLWKGKQDAFLFQDAAAGGYDAIATPDVDQLSDPQLCRSLRSSGLHHLSLRQGRTVQGRSGVARVIASIIVAMPYIVEELERAGGQRIVEVSLLAAGARHEIFDPAAESARYPYWR